MVYIIQERMGYVKLRVFGEEHNMERAESRQGQGLGRIGTRGESERLAGGKFKTVTGSV
jgi:hypothetical protein